jgi:hypothetical protein
MRERFKKEFWKVVEAVKEKHSASLSSDKNNESFTFTSSYSSYLAHSLRFSQIFTRTSFFEMFSSPELSSKLILS